jgi:hypothetical protein
MLRAECIFVDNFVRSRFVIFRLSRIREPNRSAARGISDAVGLDELRAGASRGARTQCCKAEKCKDDRKARMALVWHATNLRQLKATWKENLTRPFLGLRTRSSLAAFRYAE